jgi:hypothetical protein
MASISIAPLLQPLTSVDLVPSPTVPGQARDIGRTLSFGPDMGSNFSRIAGRFDHMRLWSRRRKLGSFARLETVSQPQLFHGQQSPSPGEQPR